MNGYMSRSPLLSPDENTVVGVNNTHSDNGEKCTERGTPVRAPNARRTGLDPEGFATQVAVVLLALSRTASDT
jgi:hypothetical protein